MDKDNLGKTLSDFEKIIKQSQSKLGPMLNQLQQIAAVDVPKVIEKKIVQHSRKKVVISHMSNNAVVIEFADKKEADKFYKAFK